MSTAAVSIAVRRNGSARRWPKAGVTILEEARYRQLLAAPVSLRAGFLALIDRELDHARQGRQAHVIVKASAADHVRTVVLDAYSQDTDRAYVLHGSRYEMAPAGQREQRPANGRDHLGGVIGVSRHASRAA